MVFFTPFNFVTLYSNFTLSFHPETKRMRKQKIFAYMAASAYHVISKGVENHIFIRKN